MTYEFEDIRLSQEIFYHLLKNHELSEGMNPALYKPYVENEAVQALVKSEAAVSDCVVERYGETVYLIPNENNAFLGFSRMELKDRLCSSGSKIADYYLSQFVILTLLIEFYDGQGPSSKVRDHVLVGELLNSVSERLWEGVSMQEEEEDGDLGAVPFNEMQLSFEALRSDDNGKRFKTTKEGFIYHILKFLESQGLIDFIERDEMIMTTVKLDNFMDWNILNDKNYERVRILRGIREGGRSEDPEEGKAELRESGQSEDPEEGEAEPRESGRSEDSAGLREGRGEALEKGGTEQTGYSKSRRKKEVKNVQD